MHLGAGDISVEEIQPSVLVADGEIGEMPKTPIPKTFEQKDSIADRPRLVAEAEI